MCSVTMLEGDSIKCGVDGMPRESTSPASDLNLVRAK